MMKPSVLALAAAALLLQACVSSSKSSVVAAMPADWRTGGRVTQIRLDHAGIEVSPQFDAVFRERVSKKLDACANGDRPLTLDARLSTVKKGDRVLMVLLGGRNKLRGEAVLTDAATGAKVGRYRIGRNITGSRFAMFQMLQAEEQLSSAFGDELCKQAFSGPVVR